MNILTELTALLTDVLPVQTGYYSGIPPDEYIVLVPLSESFSLFGDNRPHAEIQEVRLSLFTKGNYISLKNKIVCILLDADFVITDRRYIGREDDTGYFHFVLDVAKEFLIEGGT